MSLDRYSRQTRFPPLGEQGQRRLLSATALVVGCGALGSVIVSTLARAGVGRLRIVDRDFVELTNLQRQVLFDEEDVAAQIPKAIAAEAKLRKINSEIVIEPMVTDAACDNIASLAAGADVVVDGTDNFETRFLINDYSLRHGVPWIYGGCIGAEGQSMTILPGETACLRCLMGEPPPPGVSPTCDTAGILGPIVNVVASLQAAEAIKILAGCREAVSRSLAVVDLWDNRWRQVSLDGLRESSGCPACAGREFPWLDGERSSQSAVLCGRNAVQLSPAERQSLNLAEIGEKLSSVGQVTVTRYLLRLAVDEYEITLFPDGRVIIGGTDDLAAARSICARYIGN